MLGRFDVDKAKALNVPPGPLYGALKRGEAVTLDDGSVVQASQVVGATTKGACVLALFVATPGALQRLRSKLQAFLTGSASLDCIVHMAPPQIAASEAYLGLRAELSFFYPTTLDAGRRVALSNGGAGR